MSRSRRDCGNREAELKPGHDLAEQFGRSRRDCGNREAAGSLARRSGRGPAAVAATAAIVRRCLRSSLAAVAKAAVAATAAIVRRAA